MSLREIPYRWKEGRVDLAPELEAALRIPDEGRAVVTAILRERLQVPRGIGEFEDAREEPVAKSVSTVPTAQCIAYFSGRSAGKLPHGEVLQV